MFAFPFRYFAQLSCSPLLIIALIGVLLVTSDGVYANPNRAISRAVQLNTVNALKRLKLEPRVEEPTGTAKIKAASQNGNLMLLIFEDNQPRVLDFNESQLWESFTPAQTSLLAGSIRATGEFVTLDEQYRLSHWQLHQSPLPVATFALDTAIINKTPKAIFLGQDQHVAVVTDDDRLHFFSGGHHIRSAALMANVSPASVVLDPTGEFIAAPVANGDLQVWEMAAAVPIASVALEDPVFAVAAGSDAGQFFVAHKRRVDEWDLRTRELTATYPCGTACQPRQLLFDESGGELLGLSADNTLFTWRQGNTRRSAIKRQSKDSVDQVSSSPVGPLLVSQLDDGLLRFSRWQDHEHEEALTLASSTRGWALLDERGRFDGTVATPSPVSWAVGYYALPFTDFIATYLEPGLLGKWLQRGETQYLTDPPSMADGIIMPPEVVLDVKLESSTSDQPMIRATVTRIDQGGGLGELQLYHQGLQLHSEARESQTLAADKRSVVDVYRVTAVQGRNVFSARVRNPEGVLASGAQSVAQHDAPDAGRTLHLLATAINDYADPQDVLNLNYAVPDAEGIAQALKETGQGSFDRVTTSLLIDEQATKSGVINAIRGLRKAAPGDTVVLYFATHGEVFDDLFYLLLRGLALPIDTSALGQVGLSVDELAAEISRLSARRVFLLLDTCKSGDAIDILAQRSKDQRVLQVFGSNLGVNLIAATGKGQNALEVNQLGHGVFTYTLLKALAGEADRAPADGVITANEVGGFAKEQVAAMTSDFGLLPQSPTVFSHGYDYPVGKKPVSDKPTSDD